MELFATIIIVFDIALLGVALWAVFVARGLGGFVGRAFVFMAWGIIFLGVAHAFETLSFGVFKWEIDAVELIHRSIVILGFVFLILGFSQVRKLRAR